ncbi:MAG: triacylglycerol lipase [Lachnospiraceae bacterium]|nr:triacylglycerol lipase [Lachnospiraceae bacterium]MDE6251290.1 triacylglycerol lipase [Lachnospiraceae bacterium]
MIKVRNFLIGLIGTVSFFAAANSYTLGKYKMISSWLWIGWILSVVISIVPFLFYNKLQTKQLNRCRNGCEQLKIFLVSSAASICYSIAGLTGMLSIESFMENPKMWIIHCVIAILVEGFLFWNGIIRIYLSSAQLGMKWRVIGIICGCIPIVHIIVLAKLIRIASKEVELENKKILTNKGRQADAICKTKYPILMVHGVFFRDFRYFNYWGRIPKELEQNGATIYYGNHQSAAMVSESAKELDARIRQIVEETGCGKLNVIAHSKGGLDTRYALSMLGTDKYVASLTTINTPHRGCEFADYLLSKIPESQQNAVANTYNSAFQKLGDESPDFIAAVTDLTASACKKINEEAKDMPDVYYQSIGSKLNVASCGRFPLNLTYKLVKCFDGFNDGLVGEESFQWGEDYQFLTVKGKRGISHGDVIDLNRENIDGFDVREFYVELVSRLREMGF